MKLSIITINYNNFSGLKKTITSVLAQTFKDFEYIIIDGGSSDGSKELIKQYADRLTFWVSEKDNGIYHAMNKGIKVAKGEYLLFLNSGDWFTDEPIVEAFVKGTNDIDIIYGNWYHSYSDGRIIKDEFPDLVTFNFLAFEYSLPHQASLIKRNLFERIGLYDEQLKMVADWKFFLQAIFLEHCTYQHRNIYVVYYNKEGFSSNPKNDSLQHEERNLVLKSCFKNLMYLKKAKNETDAENIKQPFISKVFRRLNNRMTLPKKIFK